MKKLNIRLAIIAIVMIGFYACKKSDNSTVESKNKQNLEAFREKIRSLNAGIVYSMPLNQAQSVQFYDKNGKPKQQAVISVSGTNMRNAAVFNCDFPDMIPPTQGDLQTITNMYNCGDGYKYTVEYLVSTSVHLVTMSQLGAYVGRPSIGTIVLANSTGTVYSETNLPVTIELIGDDPTDNTLFQYRVTFTTSSITESNIQSAQTIKPRLTLYTDCDFNPYCSVTTPTGQPLLYITSIATAPCSRTDKCYISPQYGDQHMQFAGSDVVGNCNVSGFVHSGFHDFEYRVQGGSWQAVPFTSPSASTSIAVWGYQIPYTGTLGYWELAYLPTMLPSDTYEFRYRNRTYTGTQACTGEWSTTQVFTIN